MSHPLIEILGSPDPFLDRLFDQLDVNVDGFFMDHICYRVDTMEAYEQLKFDLLTHGELLSDKQIGGRPITVVEMDDSYNYHGRNFSIIELPAPKEGSPYPIGYEHVEFVVEGKLEDFIARHPDLSFDLKGMNKPINRDIRLSLDRCAVKFHESNLKEVILIEEG